jgi:AraC-like DNA-binding protein
MDLQYFLPRPDLRSYVRAYYYFSASIEAAQPICAELGNIRILLNGAGQMRLPNGEVRPIAAAFLQGPTMGAYEIEMQPNTCVFGIGIRPRGWGALLGVDAAELTDNVHDLTAVAGRIAQYAIEEVRNAEDMPAMAAAADRFFANLLKRRQRHACPYPEALERWLLSPNDLCLDQLVDMMDVSRRQTDRISKQVFGASPKLLQRKYRALRAADRIRGGQLLWTSAAGPSFYDQSHFIKEFRSFIGVTPQQFAHNQAMLITAIQTNRHAGLGKMPLASL